MDTTAAAPPDPTTHGARSAVERSPGRDLAHAAVLAFAWVSIGVLWVRVLRATSGPVLLWASATVVVTAIVTLVVTRWWIAHNVAIHRAKGPRTTVPVAPLDYDRDWVGRPVVGAWDDLRSAGIVVVCASASRKVFLADPSADLIDVEWTTAREDVAAPAPAPPAAPTAADRAPVRDGVGVAA